jgi:hypothetical protein
MYNHEGGRNLSYSRLERTRSGFIVCSSSRISRYAMSVPFIVCVLTLLLMPFAGLHFCVGLDFVTPFLEAFFIEHYYHHHHHQGWARTVTYVLTPGTYTLSCQGVHTVYVRNENLTRLLSGDIYGSNSMVYICIYVMSIFIFIYIYKYVYIYIHIYVYIYILRSMYIYIYIYVGVCGVP